MTLPKWRSQRRSHAYDFDRGLVFLASVGNLYNNKYAIDLQYWQWLLTEYKPKRKNNARKNNIDGYDKLRIIRCHYFTRHSHKIHSRKDTLMTITRTLITKIYRDAFCATFPAMIMHDAHFLLARFYSDATNNTRVLILRVNDIKMADNIRKSRG